MIRWVSSIGAVCFIMAVPPADLFAQFNPYGQGSHTYRTNADPRVRRAHRETAVARLGANARDFVETQGDEAVAAVYACSTPVAAKLAEFHASGEMDKLPRPRDLLRVIAEPSHGDDVALWAIHHSQELTDTDNFDAYLISPLEYALGLKQLAAGAAEARVRRLNRAAMATSPSLASLLADQKLAIVVGLGFLSIVGLLFWRRRKSMIC
jgi:LPXTG-motif cell wall-anchored protein